MWTNVDEPHRLCSSFSSIFVPTHTISLSTTPRPTSDSVPRTAPQEPHYAHDAHHRLPAGLRASPLPTRTHPLQEHSEVFEFAVPVWDSTGTLIQRLELPIASADDDQAVANALTAAEFLARTGLAQGDPEDIAVMLLHRAIDLITLMPPD